MMCGKEEISYGVFVCREGNARSGRVEFYVRKSLGLFRGLFWRKFFGCRVTSVLKGDRELEGRNYRGLRGERFVVLPPV